jgi:hypothetical protein
MSEQEDRLIRDRLVKMGVVVGYTPTEYSLSYDTIKAAAPAFDLALAEFIEKLMRNAETLNEYFLELPKHYEEVLGRVHENKDHEIRLLEEHAIELEQLLRDADVMFQWAEQEIRYGDDMPKHLTLARIGAWQARFRALKEKYG